VTWVCWFIVRVWRKRAPESSSTFEVLLKGEVRGWESKIPRRGEGGVGPVLFKRFSHAFEWCERDRVLLPDCHS
jgi:hypothetical protein